MPYCCICSKTLAIGENCGCYDRLMYGASAHRERSLVTPPPGTPEEWWVARKIEGLEFQIKELKEIVAAIQKNNSITKD